MAVGALAVIAFLMDQVKLRPVPEYQPQFRLEAAREVITCPGMTTRRSIPSKPSSKPFPLGLAPHKSSAQPDFPRADMD